MPFPEDKKQFDKIFTKTDKWMIGYNAGAKSNLPLRVTATVPFLTKVVDHTIAFMTGKEKKAAFKKIQAEEGENHITPARIMREMKDVELFTDINFKI
jgi:6-phosphogluconolactonase/glucosamine-6-phosphate isomerase/deaminase